MRDQTAEAAIANAANAAAKVGVGTIGLGWLTLSDFTLIAGLLIALAGYLTNLHYKRKDDYRKERLAVARLSRIDAGEEDDE